MRHIATVLKHPFFLLALLVALVYWPITFQVYAVPFDMTNCWVPWRFFISDTIQNGHFPWWNPYQQMGYPIHADLQGPTWHLESLLASMVGRQGLISIQYTLLLYIYIGGVGMYKLTSLFSDKKWILFLAATAYVCSGFFTNHTMHLFAIISGAFVPFILYYFIRLFQTNNLVYALLCSVFVFFNLTGGNQTFTIFLVYILFFLAAWFFWEVWKKDRAALRLFFRNMLVFGVASILMAAITITIFYQVHPYLTRLSAMSYQEASVFPFPPKATLSFINPMAPIGEKKWMDTDGTMSNAYFSLIFLLFFILTLFRKKTCIELIFTGVFFIALLASFGSHTFVYGLLFDYAPLLDKFRFPAYYSYLVILFGILLGAGSLDHYFSGKGITQKTLRIVGWSFMSLLIIAVIFGIATWNGRPFFSAEGFWFDKLRASNLSQNLVYYGLIQVLVFSALLIALLKHKMKLVVLIVILDCVLAAQPNLFFIGVGKNDPRLTENSLNTLNENKWPAMNPVIDNVYANRPVPGLWQNVNNLPKIIGPDGFNSNYFSSLENLMSARNAYGARILSNPYVYLSDNLVSEAMLLKDSTGLITKSTVLVSNPDYKEISESGIGLSMGDTVSTLSFLPSEFEFRVYTETGTTLNLLQSYYPGWVAYLDKHRARIYKSNTMFMTVYVPPGEHTVRFSYQNVPVMVAAAISYAGFFVAMVLISVFFFRKKEGRYWIILGWLIPAIIVIRYFFLIG